MNPLISIIIPAYNAEKYIEETLQSVLSQSYQNWECIIIDNGSTDNTQKIINHWINKDSRFQYHFYDEQKGASYARNFGIDKALGDYIAFLDSDDIWLPNHLSLLSEIFFKEKVDLVFSSVYYLENGIKTYKNIIPSKYPQIIGLQYGEKAIKNFLNSNKISTSHIICKKQILIKNGKFSHFKRSEDLYLWLKLLLNDCIFYHIDKITGYYRLSPNSLSSSDKGCCKQTLEIIYFLKKDLIHHIGEEKYQYFFKLWARKYFLLKDSKTHYIETINYINSIDNSYFTKMGGGFYKIKNILPKKLLKLLVLQKLKS